MDNITGDTQRGVLLSRTTTTGWLNWAHGELWLFPDGILRLPMGLIETTSLMGYFYWYRPRKPRTWDIDPVEFEQVKQRPHALWIPREAITQAQLNHSIGADELRVTTVTGQKLQLLWIPNPAVWSLLQQTLYEWLAANTIAANTNL